MKSTSTIFRNLRLYRLPADWATTSDQLEAALAAHPLAACGAMDHVSRGWLPAHHPGQFVHVVNGHWLIRLGVEEKLLPSATVQREAMKRAEKIEAEQQRKVGRKEMRDLRERITEELLPHVPARPRSTCCWINPAGRWLVIDAGAAARADELLEHLQRAVQGIALRPLQTLISPTSAMTGWLAENDAPTGFTIDQDLELRSAAEAKAAIRYVRHALEGQEIRQHIAQGKIATRLALTWNDRISFVLTEKLEVKRIAFLDILVEQAQQEAATAEEQFDVDFALMSGELARLLADLVLALGGELRAYADVTSVTSATATPAEEEAVA